MTFETWAALGAGVLLAMAAIARVLALFRLRARWDLLILGLRVGATTALAVALVLTVLSNGEWSPVAQRQVVLSLALATLIVHLALVWLCGIDGAGQIVDLVVLTLIIVGTMVIRPGRPPLTCAQCLPPYYVQWVLFLLGAGGVMVAGSSGLLLALRALLANRGWELQLAGRGSLYGFLQQATALALLILGAGLTMATWWAWQTLGRFASGDSREGWMAVTWLLAATSWLAWRLGKRAGRWAAVLAMMAAVVTIVGLLAAAGPYRL